MILELIKKSRTHRHFFEEAVKEDQILEILKGARFSAFGKNNQNLRYAYTVNDEKCKEIFRNIALGGALKNDERPSIDERPRGVISIVTDKKNADDNILFFNIGIVSQNMTLVANDLGLDACMIMSFNKKELDKILNIPENYTTKAVLILGKGKEKVEVVDISENDDYKYYRKNNIHYVPKIKLDDLILK